jgi:putative ABC transport system ATP-binding protein
LIAAILLERSIFLLDEVTSALDRASKAAVLDYFQSREDVTALFVAHDSDSFSFVDQVVQVDRARCAGGAR